MPPAGYRTVTAEPAEASALPVEMDVASQGASAVGEGYDQNGVCGPALAGLQVCGRGAEQVGFVEKIAPLNTLFSERWYIDRFYRRFLDVVIYNGISYLFTKNDNRIIDGGIDGLSRGTVEAGRFVSFLHIGMIQYRLLAIFVVITLLILYFFF